MNDRYWNKCDECGRFIGIESFATNKSIRKLITLDSLFSKEEYETLCEKHKEEKDGNE